MTKYLAGVLSVIAVGVLLVAYGLLNPRGVVDPSMALAAGPRSMQAVAAPGNVGNVVYVPVSQVPGYAAQAPGSPSYVPVSYVAQPTAPVPGLVSYAQPMASVPERPRAARTVSYEPEAPRRASSPRYVERAPRRDWKRTALIIGGSSATGAGVGAIFGGKKGALIGAAIAGGASTIYQTVK